MHRVTESRIVYENTWSNGFVMPMLTGFSWTEKKIPVRLPEFIESPSLPELRKQRAARLDFFRKKLDESGDFHFENLAYREELDLAHAYSASLGRYDDRIKKHEFDPLGHGCTFGTHLELLAWSRKDRKLYAKALGDIPCIGEAGDQRKRIAAVNTWLLGSCFVEKEETDVAEIITGMLARGDIPLERIAKMMCFHLESLGYNGKRKDVVLPWIGFERYENLGQD